MSDPTGRPTALSRERHRQRLGKRAEQLAIRRLRADGYAIERTNVRFPVGEIDIVAREGNTLCFVEVRSTSSSDWGGPLASIGLKKRQRLIRAAQWYLHRFRIAAEACRFDVVAIEWGDRAQPQIELVRGAFDAD